MKPRFYIIVALLLIPVQASLLGPLSLGGIKPDLGLALIYIIGLLTGPGEAALAGMGIGLLQDIGSASLIGLGGISRGLLGLSAGLLGSRVLDVASPSNSIFLAVFSLLEQMLIALFMQVLYGSVPFFSLLWSRMLPQALYTGIAGAVLIRYLGSRDAIALFTRPAVQREL